MIRKNPKKYTGASYWIENAKIVEIHEDEGTTVARVSQRGEIYFIAGRFESQFVEGDSVDVVGFVGGDNLSGAISMPAVAAASIMKSGGIMAMNRSIKWFTVTKVDDE